MSLPIVGIKFSNQNNPPPGFKAILVDKNKKKHKELFEKFKAENQIEIDNYLADKKKSSRTGVSDKMELHRKGTTITKKLFHNKNKGK